MAMPSVEFAEIETARAKAWEIRAYEREAQRDEALARVDRLAQALARTRPYELSEITSGVKGRWVCVGCERMTDGAVREVDHSLDCGYVWAVKYVASFCGDAA